jgi:hypothetical protein
MNFWSHYWKSESVRQEAAGVSDGTLPSQLNHVAGELFRGRGVEPGDVIYVLTWDKGYLYLIGSMVVDVITGQRQAERQLSYSPWKASEHVLARKPWRDYNFDLMVPQKDFTKIKFITPAGVRGLAYNKKGFVDQQTFRTLRQLTESTAGLFDSLLDA